MSAPEQKLLASLRDTVDWLRKNINMHSDLENGLDYATQFDYEAAQVVDMADSAIADYEAASGSDTHPQPSPPFDEAREREEFEREYKKKYPWLEGTAFHRNDDGSYFHDAVEDRCTWWLAARRPRS